MPKFYAVAIGRNPGIYTNWNDCKLEIYKYKDAKYKKFNTKDEAIEWMKNYSDINNENKSSKQTYFSTTGDLIKKKEKKTKKVKFSELTNHEDITIVFTDGCCINNGKKGEKILGGYGIFFGFNDPRNLAEPYYDEPTNNKAELYAIIKSIMIMEDTLISDKKHKLFIFTDSDYSLKSFTKWAKDWEKNGWKKSDGGNIKNIELIKTGFTLYKKYKSQIKIIKVKAHTGKNDAVSVYNDMADKFANQGAEKML